MKQVKKRDFVLKFSEYQEENVQIIGKDGILLGVYIPSGIIEINKAVDFLESQSRVNKDSDVVNKTEKEQRFQELKEIVENKKAGQVNDEEAVLSFSDEGFKEGIKRFEEAHDVVGTCDICKQPSKELWEHEEEGVERNVCRNCFAVRMPEKTPAQFEAFLRSKKKIDCFITAHELEKDKSGNWNLKKAAEFKDFNPIPKPLKKEKKK